MNDLKTILCIIGIAAALVAAFLFGRKTVKNALYTVADPTESGAKRSCDEIRRRTHKSNVSAERKRRHNDRKKERNGNNCHKNSVFKQFHATLPLSL